MGAGHPMGGHQQVPGREMTGMWVRAGAEAVKMGNTQRSLEGRVSRTEAEKGMERLSKNSFSVHV